ncbi:MAG: Electron transport complex protein RnfG [Firmicutes bacterium ADurb.Bin300]|nr:MAG: Electron transport complex protein RnfG [Firmicutes bacterium ADurb.Bin300]HOD03136.1 FMN-binding protein [Clostridiales bacterium]
MKSSVLNQILLPAISLFLICLGCAVLLAFTNNSTKDVILQRQRDAEDASKSAVIQGADSFSEDLTVNVDGEDYVYYEAYDKDKKIIGYIFTAGSKGYGGEVRIVTGISPDGLVTGIVPVLLNETPGLGMKAAGEDYLNQYVGKTESIGVAKSNPGKNDIQAISGATISSRAVTDAVNTAFKIYNAIPEVNVNG